MTTPTYSWPPPPPVPFPQDHSLPLSHMSAMMPQNNSLVSKLTSGYDHTGSTATHNADNMSSAASESSAPSPSKNNDASSPKSASCSSYSPATSTSDPSTFSPPSFPASLSSYGMNSFMNNYPALSSGIKNDTSLMNFRQKAMEQAFPVGLGAPTGYLGGGYGAM